MGSDSHDIQQHIGCGADTNLSQITLNVNTTTGGAFSVNIDNNSSVENLKKIVAKKLKVAKDRICLLHREKELHDGTSLRENSIVDGSKIILLPNVETGLLAQRPENTVMQALESLNDSQVNDFLSGKTPLNLSMRLGDHMMLIQLQLSTVNSSSASTSSDASTSGESSRTPMSRHSDQRTSSMRPRNTWSRTASTSQIPSTSAKPSEEENCAKKPKLQRHSSETATQQKDLMLSNEDFESLRNIVSSLSSMQANRNASVTGKDANSELEQSPIKSLSNLVSNPIKTIPIKNIPAMSTADGDAPFTQENIVCTDPISANLTSCLCKSFEGDSSRETCSAECAQMQPQTSTPRSSKMARVPSSTLLRRTLNNPIVRTKSHGLATASTSQQCDFRRSQSSDSVCASDASTPLTQLNEATAGSSVFEATRTTENLAEASRNLAKTLRHLSKEVFTNKMVMPSDGESIARASGSSTPSTSKPTNCGKVGNITGISSGAVIESMRNHGRGIYSGTFSGTLNPALQDRYGRPKRDISTVIHILNDLLSATPHYSRGARISFEPANNSRSSKHSSSSSTTTSSSSSGTSSTKHRSSNLISNHQRQCAKCIANGGRLHKDCQISDGLKSVSSRRMSNAPTLRHSIDAKKSSLSSSLPATPMATGSTIDCHQCHLRLTNSAPVSPTTPNKSIAFDDSFASDVSLNQSIASDSSSSMCALLSLRRSDSDLTTSSSLLANPICVKCSNIEMENNKTRTKLDQLRLVMQQRRERREARKTKTAPYGGRIIGASATSTSSATGANNSEPLNNATVIQAPIDAPPTNPIVEHVDTFA